VGVNKAVKVRPCLEINPDILNPCRPHNCKV